MAELFGKKYTKQEFRKHFGNISQVAGLRHSELQSGWSKGVETVDIRTGSGLNYTILPSRGMDISWSAYKEYPLGYMTPNEIRSPAYFHEQGAKGFLDNFFAGLLTTCGITHFGTPCRDGDDDLGLHGLVNNIPARNLSLCSEWVEDEYIMKVRGEMVQSRFYGENIVLKREIQSKMGESVIKIHDRVENLGFRTQPLMLLYHIQFGHPIVGKDTELLTSPVTTRPRDENAALGLDRYMQFQEPTAGFIEQCFYQDHEPDADGCAFAALQNMKLGEKGLSVYVKYHKSQLPYFVQWKQMGEQEYVVGLEPGTWYAEGRAEARKSGDLMELEPGEVKHIELEVGVVEGPYPR